MDWLDISVPISERTPIFSGDPTFHRSLAAAIDRGDVCNLTRLDMGAHTGTHLDAPRHFIEGAPTSESIGQRTECQRTDHDTHQAARKDRPERCARKVQLLDERGSDEPH